MKGGQEMHFTKKLVFPSEAAPNFTWSQIIKTRINLFYGKCCLNSSHNEAGKRIFSCEVQNFIKSFILSNVFSYGQQRRE